MEFLSDEVYGALIAQKIREESTDTPHCIPSEAAFHVSSKQPKSGRKDRREEEPFYFARQRVTGPKNARR